MGGLPKLSSSSSNRRDQRRREMQPKRVYRNRDRSSSAYSSTSEEVTVSPSKSVPSLPDRSTESYCSGASSARSDFTLCVDEPSAICPSMRMSEHDSKTTYQLRDGSMLEIIEKANSGGKAVSLKLRSGEQIHLERSDEGHSLMMLDRKHRVVHAVGTDWQAPEAPFRA